MIKVNVTYDVITPESASRGDFEETGFEVQDKEFESKEEALKWFSDNYGCFEKGNETSYYTIDPERNYKTGAEKYYAIHF